MLDLSGAPRTAPASGSRGQRLWAVLLVLDAFFVIVFGGALAAKIYSHLQAPPAPVAPPRHGRAARTPETPKPAEPPKPATPAPMTPEPAPTVKADQVKPPKPSLLHEAPRREAAKLRSGARTEEKAVAAPPAPEGKVKAVAVD